MSLELPSASPFDGNGFALQAVTALQNEPGFDAACVTFTRGMTGLYQGNRLLNTLVSDRGRAVVGNLALYLHYGLRPDDPRSGLTVSRLKALCVEHNICSPGRTEAFIAVLRLFGQLAPGPKTLDSRIRRLVPTERMLASYRQRWHVAFSAIGKVLPAYKAAHDLLGREEFEAALVRHFAKQFLDGTRLIQHAAELTLFVERNAGVMVLFSLLNASARDERFLADHPITISISELARRFGVSRVHVRKLLRDAEAERLIESGDGGGTLILRPQLVRAARNFVATSLLFVAHCARAALDEVGESPPHVAVG